jgi:hypothetical protein
VYGYYYMHMNMNWNEFWWINMCYEFHMKNDGDQFTSN